MNEEKTAAEVWCRECRHYDTDGTGKCAGCLSEIDAEEHPPCAYWGEGYPKYEPNENGERNW